MKVGFVFDTFLLKKDNNYYAQTLTYDFFKQRYLDKCKSISVITRVRNFSDYNGNTNGYKISNGENVEVNPISEYNSIPDSIIRNKIIKKHLKLELKKCDRVIIRMPSVLGIISCDICEKEKIPYLIEMVACAWDGYMNHTNSIGKVIAPFMYYYTKKMVKKSNWVIYVTNCFLQRRYPTRGKSFSCSDVVLPNNDIDLNKLSSKEFDKTNFKMCTIANVGMKYKGHKYALLAIKKLKIEGINIKYLLAGNGNQDYLKKYAEKYGITDNIVFLGSLNHDEVFKLLDNIDIYIQPSLQEGLPRALIEAMSRGCCCIGSNAGGIPELLNEKYVFKKKNVKELIIILQNLNKQEVIEERIRNYRESQKYDKIILNKKRDAIYNEFFYNLKNVERDFTDGKTC